MSIATAAVTVLREARKPLSVSEIYEAILAKKLYSFKAKQPMQVLQQQLRRHSLGVANAASSKIKLFSVSEQGRFALLPDASK